jgi:hypothetical protein
LAGAGFSTGRSTIAVSVSFVDASVATGSSSATRAGGAAGLAGFLAAGFLVATLGINLIWLVTRFRLPAGNAARKSSRIGRAASGKVQFGFTDRLGFFLSQNGKGNIAVNEASLLQKRPAVKLEIFLCAFRSGGCYKLKT